MKLVLLGDVHLRYGTPVSRADDFHEAQWNKLNEIFDYANTNNAPIVCTGDLFDRPDPPYSLVVKYLPLFTSFKHGFYVVPGNHDVYGATLSTVNRSALGVMAASGAITLLGKDATIINDTVAVVGKTYMDNISPVPTKDKFNILVSHAMIIQEKIWREQEDFTLVEDYVTSCNGWDLILCGHYHYRFIHQEGRQVVINPGAMTRIKASKGDMALLPGVYLFDTDTRSYMLYELRTAKPANEVFVKIDKNPITTVSPSALQLDSFVEELANEQSIYTDNLTDIVITVQDQLKTNERVKTIIDSILSEARGMPE